VASDTEGEYGFGRSMCATEEICFNSGVISGRLNADNGTAVLTGLAGLLYTLSLVERTSKGSLMVYVPYKTVVQELLNESPLGIKQVLKGNSDLIQLVRTQLQHLRENYTVTLVQDIPEPSPLPLQQAMAATHRYLNYTTAPIENQAIVTGLTPSCTAYLVTSGSADERLSKRAIHASLYAKDLQETIVRAEQWGPDVFHLVAWETYGKMFSKLGRARQVSVAKNCHRLIQTNSRNRTFYWDSGLCVCCG
jgi:hypothetical protein